MKKMLLRIGAFIVDNIIILLATALICLIPLINPHMKELSDNQNALNHEVTLAQDLMKKTEKYLEDGKINEFEYQEILDDFPTYYELFKDVIVDGELSDDFKNNIQKNIQEKYASIYNEYSYTISKLGFNESIISIILYLLYFGLLPFIMNGQTLAKKILRLKVVDNKDEDKKIPLWKYLVRAFLICELAFTIASLIMIKVTPKNVYLNATYWVNEAKYIYEIIFLLFLVLRDDQRSVHDLLLGTTVIRLDKNGNKIADPILPDAKDEAKEVKTIPPKKKNSKKEEVKAEKIND